jgi:eukaryotic-like serine/threonine-protein kinase
VLLKRLIIDMHRRSLWQVLAIYLVGAWGALQVVEALTNSAGLPDWVPGFALVLLIIGLPIVLATAFIQEGLPGGAPETQASIQEDTGKATSQLERRSDPAAAPESSRAKHHALFTWRNAIVGGVGAFALLGFVSAGYMGMRTFGIGSPGTLLAQGVLEEGAPVLLADFASGEDVELGAVVTRTLRIDLLQSRTIRVLDRADLRAALERAHLDAAQPISGDVAAQLAEREGYAAVIAGDIATAGTGYVLTASILGGEAFRPLAGFRESARSDAELVDAIERLSRAIRDKAGESLRSVRGGPSLAQVTTSSLAALRVYTRAEQLELNGDYRSALEQYERAVALDSTFAMAHRKIAGTLLNLNMRRPDVVRAARRAYELRERLPELERYLTTGMYHDWVSGDLDGAIRSYEQALAIDSSNASVRNSLANSYLLKGRFPDAERLYAGALRERPIAALFMNLARTRYRMGDVDAAFATVDSAVVALPDLALAYHVGVMFAGSGGDLQKADSLLAVLDSKARTPLERENARLDRYLLAAHRGKLREAERLRTAAGAELFLAEPHRRAMELAGIRLLRGDTAGAVSAAQELIASTPDPGTLNDVDVLIDVLVEAKAVAAATQLLAAWQAAVPADELGVHRRISRELATGQVARVRGDFPAALATLENLRGQCPGCPSFVTYEIARTHEDMGNADLAIGAYERALEQSDPGRFYDYIDYSRTLRRLGELHDARGDGAKAAEYYTRFVDLWRNADPELQPQVRAAQARLTRLLPDRS